MHNVTPDWATQTSKKKVEEWFKKGEFSEVVVDSASEAALRDGYDRRVHAVALVDPED